jgi:hypothetical protein
MDNEAESEAGITTEIERYMAIPTSLIIQNWPIKNHGIQKAQR